MFHGCKFDYSGAFCNLNSFRTSQVMTTHLYIHTYMLHCTACQSILTTSEINECTWREKALFLQHRCFLFHSFLCLEIFKLFRDEFVSMQHLTGWRVWNCLLQKLPLYSNGLLCILCSSIELINLRLESSDVLVDIGLQLFRLFLSFGYLERNTRIIIWMKSLKIVNNLSKY